MERGILSLKWNNHKKTFLQVISSLCLNETLSDVTLTCEGKFYDAHKLVLSACSEYFENIFQHLQGKHSVIVLKDVSSQDLEALLNFMYEGIVNVPQERLSQLIAAAEYLQVKGLSESDQNPEKICNQDLKRYSPFKPENIHPAKRKKINKGISNEFDIQDSSNEYEKSPYNDDISFINVREETFKQENIHPAKRKKLNPDISEINKDEQKYNQNINRDMNNMFEKPHDDISFVDIHLKEEPSEDMYNNHYKNINEQRTDQNIINCESNLIQDFTALNRTESNIKISEEEIPDELNSITLTNEENTPYYCHFCPFETYKECHYNSHLKSHSEEKEYVCTYCHYRTYQMCNLKAHIRKHTGEKPYSCPHCSYRSTQSSNIKIHIKRMHKNESTFHSTYE